jgi:hypothetical protein
MPLIPPRVFSSFSLGQHAAEPAVIDKELIGALGLFANGVLGLLLGADKKHLFPVLNGFADEAVGILEVTDGFLQVNDIDSIARAEDVRLHLGVPALGLMTEMDTGLQQLLHGDLGHAVLSPLRFGLVFRPLLSLSELRGLRSTSERVQGRAVLSNTCI